MINLVEIEKKYSQKVKPDGFLEIYEKYFKDYREKEIKLLEIGVDRGDSLRLWREYFTKATICGIDIKQKDFNIDGVDILCGDQTDYNFLKSIVEKYKNFDIIIDDGSHVSKHIIKSIEFLFNYLKNNGLYVIEDLQTSYMPRFGGSRYNLTKSKTSMNYLKSLADSINYEHKNKPFFKRKKFDGAIKYVHFYQNIAIIKKGDSTKYFYKDEKEIRGWLNNLKKLISLFYK